MEYGANEFIKILITSNFPYPKLTGSYTGEESERYTKMIRWIRPFFWLGCFFYIFGIAAILLLYIQDIAQYVGQLFTSGRVFRDISFFSFVYCAMFGAGLGFPMLSVWLLKLIFPFQQAQLLDFISYKDEIDVLKLGRWLSRWFCSIALLLFAYDVSDNITVGSKTVYVKDVLNIPRTIAYASIQNITCDSTIAYQTPGDTTWRRNYRIHTQDVTVILQQVTGLDSCAALIAGRAHRPVMHTGRIMVK